MVIHRVRHKPILFCVSPPIIIHFVSCIFMTEAHISRQKSVYAKAPHVEPCLDISKRIREHKLLYCSVCEQPCQTSVYHLTFPEAQTSRQRLHLFFLLKDVFKTTAFCSFCFKGRIDVSVRTSEDKLESK